jgi:peptidoglycan/xylan/chitin deacetylase (PgdA/CDA1 family)
MPKRIINAKRMLIIVVCLAVLTGLVIRLYGWYTNRNSPPSTTETHIADDEPLAVKHAAPLAPQSTAVVKQKHDYSVPVVTNGLAPVLSYIPTKEKVVFLGIDDGAARLPGDLDIMKTNNIHASLFLADRFIHADPGFFKDYTTAGSLIEDHTVDHKLLSHLSYDEQKQEICDEADKMLTEYGRRPVFMRPPGGDYNVDTQKAAAACGMKAVVLWVAKANGGSMQYQVGHSLRPGDIVLMHFRPEFAKDMQAFVTAENAAGLHTELLEDWL